MEKAFEKILERLENVEKSLLGVSADNGCTYGIMIAMERSKRIVKEMAEEYSHRDDGWIPVSERLPETDENRDYLVCSNNGRINIAEFICKTSGGADMSEPWWLGEDGYDKYPIAWMPLPAPYKEKGEQR